MSEPDNNIALGRYRWPLMAVAVLGLATVFLFQESFGRYLTTQMEGDWAFALNRILRVLLNDVCMLLLLMSWFQDRSILKLAFLIQLLDGLILLPVYLVAKLTLEGPEEISAPLLSQFHRLIVNPTLMILLIPGVYFQRMNRKV